MLMQTLNYMLTSLVPCTACNEKELEGQLPTILQKMVGNFYYVSIIRTVYTVSGRLKYLNV